MTETDDREGDTAKVNEGFCEAFLVLPQFLVNCCIQSGLFRKNTSRCGRTAFFRMMTEADDREGDTAQ